MLSAMERMDIVLAYQQVGTYGVAAEIFGTTHKTVARVIERAHTSLAGRAASPRQARARNCDDVVGLVAERVAASRGKTSAKRLLPVAVTAGYTGSTPNFRRLVAQQKTLWRSNSAQYQRRPTVWAPGEYLVIDWAGTVGGLHLFCAVLAWSRFRFVAFAADEKATTTTLALIAEAFAAAGGVPAKVPANRMACLKGAVVANVVVPAPAYVRFATHYGFAPDFCHAADPASKGTVNTTRRRSRYRPSS